MKVLFVGNSHTYFHDMPALFARFAEITTGQKADVTMLAYSGRDLKWHQQEYLSLRFNLLYGGYDFCIIQQAAHPYPPREETLKTGADIMDLCHRADVTPVVYMTWAEKRFPENQQKMIDTCEQLARENNGLLAPVGRVWQHVQNAHPQVDLYHTDGEHASPYGDFLIAAVLCKLLTGSVNPAVSGEGLNFFMPDPMDAQKMRIVTDKALLPMALNTQYCDWILQAVDMFLP